MSKAVWSLYQTRSKQSCSDIVVYKTLNIGRDLHYEICVAGAKIKKCSLFSHENINGVYELQQLLHSLSVSSVCIGNNDEQFQGLSELRGGIFTNCGGK